MSSVAKAFKIGQMVVYPAHGIGTITEIERQTIDTSVLDLFVISFEKENMKLRVPVNKAASVGLRKICSSEEMQKALEILETPCRSKRMLWSRRAQKYESKINSGDVIQIAEVVRDLSKFYDSSKQSYSERLIYQLALERLVDEYAAVEGIDSPVALQRLELVLQAA